MWKLLLLPLILIGCFLLPCVVEASTTADVVITVTGFVVASPGDFTITYVSDYELGISWTKPAGAVNTMVRVKYGSLPADRTDGYLVYYGTDASFTDTNADLTSPRVAYYRAWSQRADGIWEEIGANKEANFMSQSYLWIGLIIAALGLSTLSFVYRQIILSVLSAFAWIMCAMVAYSQTNLSVAIITPMVLFFVFCFLAMLATTWKFSSKPQEPVVPYSHKAHLRETLEQYRESRRRL